MNITYSILFIEFLTFELNCAVYSSLNLVNNKYGMYYVSSKY